jgi:2-polyprenyl-6-methoxyphenol hydroxylase-like FAD-dependent oxidoreductase
MFDAIVVGARCAGSPTAMLLARHGYRVLLVDRARFPSDTISTLVVWPHGAEILDRWGLLDGLVATGCPPVAQLGRGVPNPASGCVIPGYNAARIEGLRL